MARHSRSSTNGMVASVSVHARTPRYSTTTVSTAVPVEVEVVMAVEEAKDIGRLRDCVCVWTATKKVEWFWRTFVYVSLSAACAAAETPLCGRRSMRRRMHSRT